MQQQNKKLPLILAGVVVLAVVGALVYQHVQHARAVQMAQAAAQLEAERAEAARRAAQLAAERAAQIAVLEGHLAELNRNYADAMKKAFVLRKQLLADKKNALAQEVEAARRAVEDAIDHHPAIMGMHEDMAQKVEVAHDLSDQQAVIVTKIDDNRKQRQKELDDLMAERTRQMVAVRKDYLDSIGKKLARLTPEESKQVKALQDKYLKEHPISYPNPILPDDTEKKLSQDFDALGKQRIAADDHYANVFNNIPAARAHVRANDPVIAALDRALIEKNARLQAATAESPELAALMQQVQAVDQQRNAVLAELMNFKPSATASSAKAPVVSTNG